MNLLSFLCVFIFLTLNAHSINYLLFFIFFPAVLAKRTAKEKAAALALTDDYKLDEALNNKHHRLSRKKRRRLESLEAVDEDNKEESFSEFLKGCFVVFPSICRSLFFMGSFIMFLVGSEFSFLSQPV